MSYIEVLKVYVSIYSGEIYHDRRNHACTNTYPFIEWLTLDNGEGHILTYIAREDLFCIGEL